MKTPEEIIRTKTFDQLTVEEKLLVQDLASNAAEFDSIKLFYCQLDQLPVEELPVVSTHVKNSLDQVFQAKHPGIQSPSFSVSTVNSSEKVIPVYQKTWFRIAAILLLSISVMPYFFMRNSQLQNSKKVATHLPLKIEKSTNNEGQLATVIKNKPQLLAQTVKQPSPKTFEVSVSETDFNLEQTMEPAMSRPIQKNAFNIEVSSINYSESDEIANRPSTALKAGISADLYPNSAKDQTTTLFVTPVPASELLSLLTPAF